MKSKLFILALALFSVFFTHAQTCASIYDASANGAFSNASTIPLNQDVTGLINPSGDNDYYKFTLSGVSDLNIRLTNLPADYDMFLYDSGGAVITASLNGGTSNESITLSRKPAGTYYVRVYAHVNGTYNASACYTLNVGATLSCYDSYDVSNNDGLSSAATIPLNQDVKGLINPFGDVDYYKFTLSGISDLNIRLTNLPADYDMALYNSAGTQTIATSQNGGTSNENITLTRQPAGTYYVKVLAHVNGTYNASACYTLNVGATISCPGPYDVSNNDGLSSAATIPLNQDVTGLINPSGDLDYYKFTLSAASDLKIRLTNLPADYDIDLYDVIGESTPIIIATSQNGGTSNESITKPRMLAGTYYVKVYAFLPEYNYNASACYTLNVGATISCPGPYDVSNNNTQGGAATIPLNQDVTGLINPSGDVDYYKFTITTGGTIKLTLTTLPADYSLYLFNSSGMAVAVSSNTGTTSETINYTAVPGTYYAFVAGGNGTYNASQCYTLRVATGTASRVAAPDVQTDVSIVQNGNQAKKEMYLNQAISELNKTKTAIYPNPANKLLNIVVADLNEKATILISDASGRRLIQQPAAKINNGVNVQHLAKGTYFVQVITDKGVVLMQSKFIKQ